MSREIRFKELIENLLEKTKAEKLKWEPTVSDDEFVASIGGEYSATLGRRYYASHGRGEVFLLSLRDEYDRELSRIHSDDIEYEEVATKLPSLYELARRQALQVDEKVDDLLGKLKVL